MIELYFLNEETEFTFASRNEARKFVNATLNLLTNKSTFERNAEKVKSTISTIDNTFGIDSMGITSNVLKNGVVGKTANVLGKGIKTLGSIINKKK